MRPAEELSYIQQVVSFLRFCSHGDVLLSYALHYPPVNTVNYGILGRILRKDGKYAGLICSGQERDRKKWSMHIYYEVESRNSHRAAGVRGEDKDRERTRDICSSRDTEIETDVVVAAGSQSQR